MVQFMEKMASKSKLLLNAILIYWKSLFVLFYPLVLLPVFLHNNQIPYRCMYVVLLMAGYWVFEVLPLPVTSLIPMVLFPLMGVLDTEKTAVCYFKDTNMMFVGGLIIAIAVQHCNLHTRVSLYVIKLVGCSPRRLHFGLITVTMFVSMWISNTAATAMMIPIIEATLKELEDQNIGQMYESDISTTICTKVEGENITLEVIEQNQSSESNESTNSGAKINKVDEQIESQEPNANRRPTRTTMCYFIGTAYAASIGGMGCIVGSGTNLIFKGIYESTFPDNPSGIEFAKWMALNVPMMLVMMYITIIWLQFWFMGLFRPNSIDAKAIHLGGEQREQIARKLIMERIKELGPMSFHEWSVASLFLLSIILWFFRQPEFITGWAELVTHVKIKDSTPALIIVLLFFIIPSKPNFLYSLSSDPQKRPTQPSNGLITWKVIHQKLPWGLIFLIGGGLAVAKASEASGMSKLIADNLSTFVTLPKFIVLLVSCLLATVLTQFSSNVAMANVLLPVLAQMSKKARVHPLYWMLPTSLCCSFAYCLPVSTPPNAIAASPCNMRSWEMVKVGLGVCVVSLGVLLVMFGPLAHAIWDLEGFPTWAES